MCMLERLDRWLTKSHEQELLRVDAALALVERKRERVLQKLGDAGDAAEEVADAFQ